MKLFKPSELHQFLQELGIVAKKSLSQHFLIDGNIIRKILKAAKVDSSDLIIEIGPGPGALTEALLETGAKVIAIEMDKRFADALARLQTSDERLEVVQADFLQFPIEDFLKNRLKSLQKAKVVANLPYRITTPILAALLPMHSLISTLTIMVQKEVGERFVAPKGCADYSSFTLFLQFYASAQYCFTVEASCFSPPPKVKSAVMHCNLHTPPAVEDVNAFFLLTRTAFQHRRKMLRASLKELYTPKDIENSLKHLSLNPQARPQDLSLQEFIALFHALRAK